MKYSKTFFITLALIVVVFVMVYKLGVQWAERSVPINKPLQTTLSSPSAPLSTVAPTLIPGLIDIDFTANATQEDIMEIIFSINGTVGAHAVLPDGVQSYTVRVLTDDPNAVIKELMGRNNPKIKSVSLPISGHEPYPRAF